MQALQKWYCLIVIQLSVCFIKKISTVVKSTGQQHILTVKPHMPTKNQKKRQYTVYMYLFHSQHTDKTCRLRLQKNITATSWTDIKAYCLLKTFQSFNGHKGLFRSWIHSSLLRRQPEEQQAHSRGFVAELSVIGLQAFLLCKVQLYKCTPDIWEKQSFPTNLKQKRD